MEELELPTSYTAIPGAPHGFMGQQKAFDFCIDHSAAFFDKHLR